MRSIYKIIVLLILLNFSETKKKNVPSYSRHCVPNKSNQSMSYHIFSRICNEDYKGDSYSRIDFPLDLELNFMEIIIEVKINDFYTKRINRTKFNTEIDVEIKAFDGK